MQDSSTPIANQGSPSNLRLFCQIYPGIYAAMLVIMSSGTINAIMAAHISTSAMAALALSGSIIWPLNAIGQGMLATVFANMGYLIGKNRPREVGEIHRQSYFVIIYSSIVIMILLAIMALNLEFFGLTPDIIEIARPYLLLNIINVPLIQIGYQFRNLNNSISYSIPNLWLSLVQLALIVPLNYLFMYGHIPFLPKSPAMSAFTSMTTMVINIIFQLFIIKYKPSKFKDLKLFTPLFSKPNRTLQKDFFFIGIPRGLQYWMENSFYGIVSVFIAHLGTYVVAANEAGMIVYGVCYSTSIAASSTITAVASRRLGEQNRKLAEKASNQILTFVLIFNIIVAIILINYGKYILDVLVPHSKQAYDLAFYVLIFLAISNIFDGLYSTLMGYLIPYRDSKYCMWVSTISAWVVYMPIACILGFTTWFFGYGNYGLYAFWSCFVAIAITCFVLYFVRAYFYWHKMPDDKLYAILSAQDTDTAPFIEEEDNATLNDQSKHQVV